MKKTLKRTCAVALALTATAGVTGINSIAFGGKTTNNSNNSVVYAESTEVTEGVLKITQYQKNVKLGDEFTMPTATLAGTAIAEYTVKTPSGKTFNQTSVTDNKFKVEEIGTYTITYKQGDYVGEVTFKSTISSYNINLESNNNRILPAKVGTNYNIAEKDIFVPSYVITDANGEEVDGVTPVIKVTTPDFKTVDVTAEGKIDFAGKSITTLVKGTYIVTYSVYSADGHFLASTKTEFKCVAGDAYDEDDKLVLSYSKEKPESVNVGKTIELPGVTAKIDGEAIPVYYTVEILKNGTDVVAANTKVGNTDKEVLTINEKGVYEFTANEIVNYYTVKYTVKSALNAKESTTEFVIDTVEDSIKPTPIVVEAYETDDVADLKNVDYKLASNFNNQDIKILPIYAEDLGTFNYADFKFKREIRNSSYEVIYTDEENANKNIIFNYTGADNAVPADSVVAKDKDGEKITLADGTYYVYYTATDKSGNSNSVNYKFVVDGNFDGRDEESNEVKPVVTYNDVFFAAVDKGEEITFGKVTFSDDNDDRLETEVSYQYYNGTTALETKTVLELNNNKYVINTENAPAEATKVVIYATATNDSGFTTVEEKEIVINSEVTGTTAPKVISVDSYTNTAVQGEEIVLPTIVFEDDIISSLDAEIAITCTTDAGDVINYDAVNALAIRSESAKTYTYSNASFVAATAGSYQVAIKATDAAGNVVVKFLTYTVTDATYTGSLRFTNIGLTNTTIQLGDTFKLPTATIAGTNGNLYAYEVRCIEGPAGYKLNNDRFVADKVGDYTLQYVMYEIANPTNILTDETVEVKITVEDTTAPEIYVDWQTTILNGEEISGEILGAYAKGTKLLLPTFSASDLSGIDESKSLITITCSSSSSTRTIKFADMANEFGKAENGTMYYTFSRDGEYTITYTAYDKQGQSSKKIFTIRIGDLDAPEFEVDDRIVKSEYKIGDEIVIDLNDDSLNYFTFEDADTTLTKTDIKAVLKVNDVEVKNQETETGKFRFKLEEAGSYELTFTITDSANNKSQVTKTFTIAETANESDTQQQTIGTILIVVSVVVLAGVVVYFVVSKKKMDKMYK